MQSVPKSVFAASLCVWALSACSLGQEFGAYDFDESDFPEAERYPTLLEATEPQSGQIDPLTAAEIGAAQDDLDELREDRARAQRRAGQPVIE